VVTAWDMAGRQESLAAARRCTEAPQERVARVRAHVLGGCGPGADKAESDRYKRERPTLGAWPAPLARELVHLETARIRSGHAADVDDVPLHNQIKIAPGTCGAPTPAQPPVPNPQSRGGAALPCFLRASLDSPPA
jgi:hypothetical protein